MVTDEIRVRQATAHVGMLEQPNQKIAICLNSLNGQASQSIGELSKRRLAIRSVRNDLGEQRVVVDPNLRPLLDSAFNPQPFNGLRKTPFADCSGRRQESV